MVGHEDSEAIATFLGLMGDRENIILDFSDERQYRAALALHNLGGHTPQTRPGMHAALADRRERHLASNGIDGEQLPQDTPFQTGAHINEVSRVPGTENAAASGFASVLDGALQLNATIAVFDAAGTTTLACGSGSQFDQGQHLKMYAAPLPGRTVEPQMTGTILYSYQQRPGGRWTTGATRRDVSLGVLADPVVIHPSRHQTGVQSPYIRIGLGRGASPQDDVDYWYWFNSNVTTYALPWYGSVTFTAPPQELRFGVNPQIFGTLLRGGGKGGFAYLPTDSALNLFDNLHVSGNTLAWTLTPPVDKPPWNSMGNPLLWGDLKWGSGEADYLTIQLAVALEGEPIQAVATIQSCDDSDQDPLDGVTYIPPVQFLWSCLVAGTPILLADGSTIPIEDVVHGSVVRCGDGIAREVCSTTIFRFRGEVVKLRTEDGNDIALSGNHPVRTADRFVQAYELEPGDQVRVSGGATSVLVEAAREPYEGLLCNLRLDESSEPDPAHSSVFADGIEVGDYALQLSFHRSRGTDHTRIRATLEPRYAADFERYLSEIAAGR